MNKFFILLIISIALIYTPSVFGAAWYPCCFEWSLDKTEYSPQDTVLITVKGTESYANSTENITVKISDLTYGPDNVKVVFEKQKAMQDGVAIFEYKITQASDRYRYQVDVDTPGYDSPMMFFTKKDASKIVISDFKLFTPMIKQGEPIKFEAKVVDGVGNPAHYLRISASSEIPHQSCSTERAGWVGASIDVSPLFSTQPDYWSKGIVRGEIPISNTAKPGKYDFKIFAGGDVQGYQNVEKISQIEIEQYDGPRDPPYSVFGPMNFKFKPGFMTEQEINFTAQTVYDGCGPPLPNVPLKAEIRKYDIHTNQYETLTSQELVSDENGYYHVYFEPIGLQTGYFSLVFTSTYPGVEGAFSLGDSPHNTKNFTITAEGKDFLIETDTWYSLPQTIEFDQSAKKLTLDVDTSDTYRRISFTVPTELLDGDLLVYENGLERGGTFSKQTGYTQFDFHTNSDHSHIEIVGTTAIPEFGFIVPMILLVSIIPIVFTRWLKDKLV